MSEWSLFRIEQEKAQIVVLLVAVSASGDCNSSSSSIVGYKSMQLSRNYKTNVFDNNINSCDYYNYWNCGLQKYAGQEVEIFQHILQISDGILTVDSCKFLTWEEMMSIENFNFATKFSQNLVFST